MTTDWNPAHYLHYADERGRPYFDLVSRINAAAPQQVVDLGCGPGNLTASLATRWPQAQITGVDRSPAMINKAQSHATTSMHPDGSMEFVCADLLDWLPERAVEVMISNATLQWVHDHRTLWPRLLSMITNDGWLAFQVPGNFAEPSHTLLHELADQPEFASYTAGLRRPAAADPVDYLGDLTALGCAVDAWETTYLHVLTGPDPVFTWISSTGARPILAALPDDLRPGFVQRYQQALREAYPAQDFGTILPFRRIFCVARKNG